LALVRERIEAMYRGDIRGPASAEDVEGCIVYSAALTAAEFEIPIDQLLEFAEGCHVQSVVRRHATWQSLQRQLSRTGGRLAFILASVLGLTRSDAQDAVEGLGMAMEFTRTLANIGRDASSGRIYLPLEDLARFRYSERQLLSSDPKGSFREFIHFEIERARELYRASADAICWLAGEGSRMAAGLLVARSIMLLNALESSPRTLLLNRGAPLSQNPLRQFPIAWRLAHRRPGGALPRGVDVRNGDARFRMK
jgi:phytoene synthase